MGDFPIKVYVCISTFFYCVSIFKYGSLISTRGEIYPPMECYIIILTLHFVPTIALETVNKRCTIEIPWRGSITRLGLIYNFHPRLTKQSWYLQIEQTISTETSSSNFFTKHDCCLCSLINRGLERELKASAFIIAWTDRAILSFLCFIFVARGL